EIAHPSKITCWKARARCRTRTCRKRSAYSAASISITRTTFRTRLIIEGPLLLRNLTSVQLELEQTAGNLSAMTTSHKGQAWYVLRGYRYQLLLSLDAWLGLRSDEILLLETEEDFSVESATAAVD